MDIERRPPPPDLKALWRIEGHLRNISHCMTFLVFAVCLWAAVALGGSLLRLADATTARPSQHSGPTGSLPRP
jgi:hypothetical protein